jgi:alkanesulfonate monooxygenase SsuD/methylene tetrahydromethanopterin reductase-like flavin-dependent oxidoreductase (luciferase family)
VTRRVPVGICLPADVVDPAVLRAAAERIEAHGFDQIAVGEHVLASRPTPAAFTTLAFVAGVTESIGLLSAVVLAPLYPPALLAKLAASLDAISGGRFILGVGVGGEVPAEFEACGVPVGERGERTDDALRVVQALTSSEGPVSLESPRWRLDHVALQPAATRPVPLWVAGRSDAAARRAVRFASAWLPYLITPEQLADRRERLRQAALELSRPEPRTVAFCFCGVGADRHRARRDATTFVSDRYSLPTDRVRRYVVAGTPAECVSQLRTLHDAGAAGFVLRLTCEDRDFDRMLDAVANEVVPGLDVGEHDDPAERTMTAEA